MVDFIYKHNKTANSQCPRNTNYGIDVPKQKTRASDRSTCRCVRTETVPDVKEVRRTVEPDSRAEPAVALGVKQAPEGITVLVSLARACLGSLTGLPFTLAVGTRPCNDHNPNSLS